MPTRPWLLVCVLAFSALQSCSEHALSRREALGKYARLEPDALNPGRAESALWQTFADRAQWVGLTAALAFLIGSVFFNGKMRVAAFVAAALAVGATLSADVATEPAVRVAFQLLVISLGVGVAVMALVAAARRFGLRTPRTQVSVKGAFNEDDRDAGGRAVIRQPA